MANEDYEAANSEQIKLLNNLVADEPVQLQLRQEVIMQKLPEWSRLERVNLISNEDSDYLRKMHLLSLDEIEDLILKNPKIMFVILNILHFHLDIHPMQYVLTILYELVRDNTGRYEYICKILEDSAVFNAFDQLLQNPSIDAYTADKAIFLLSGFIRSSTGKFSTEEVQYLCQLLVQGRGTKRIVASEAGRLDALINLLKISKFRRLVWDTPGAVATIKNGVQITASPTSHYRGIFCIWLLSFEEDLLKEISKVGLDACVCEIMKESRKEKVVRVFLKVLNNFLKNEDTVETLINMNIFHVLTVLEYEKWRDATFYDEIQQAISLLDRKIKTFSNFDRYCLELDRGILRWSVIHSEKFWRENVLCFENGEFLAIKKLISLLRSNDTVTLSVACYDLGEFARFHPAGKKICQKLKVKDVVMLFINSSNREVATEALLCLQKLMLNNWQDVAAYTGKR
ncbi:putative vacuolar ATP synthase subunit 54kD [Cardiosporidium cionae]|uniref:V-type proton ATPase subunit H n=1 Tax=Cardiosporidium cionae TaxID=476202 RepID=A0ABQ7JD78_9APIC|nr:putative vacuolar ATP synthase subunit 54kD [Cardiosporidium cionae]|eukprot:KAF8821914.1 putative vacuolar ATP synthase subunit 54kD [Cardiosporidium cionae]